MDIVTRFRQLRDRDRAPDRSRETRTEQKWMSLRVPLEKATSTDFEYLIFAAAADSECGGLVIDCRTATGDYREALGLLARHLGLWSDEYQCIGLFIAMHRPGLTRVAFALFHPLEISHEVRVREYLSIDGVAEKLAVFGYDSEE